MVITTTLATVLVDHGTLTPGEAKQALQNIAKALSGYGFTVSKEVEPRKGTVFHVRVQSGKYPGDPKN